VFCMKRIGVYIWFTSIYFFVVCTPAISQSDSNSDVVKSSKTARYFGPHQSININEKQREAYISKTSQQWIKSQEDTLFELLTAKVVDLSDYKQTSYRVKERGTIRFLNGEEVKIIIHSSHEDGEIGDVSMAITNEGKVYVNYGHICGGLIHFYKKDGEIPSSSNDFFNHYLSDTDDMKWQISDICKGLTTNN